MERGLTLAGANTYGTLGLAVLTETLQSGSDCYSQSTNKETSAQKVMFAPVT